MAVLVFFTLELSEADVLTCRMIYNTTSVLVFCSLTVTQYRYKFPIKKKMWKVLYFTVYNYKSKPVLIQF